jgi:hypothetical protein
MSRQDIDFKIGADLKQFRSAMGNIDHSLRKLSGGFGALGGVIGASFAVDAVKQFVSESVQLAAQAEGVKAAFDRLNDPGLLDDLRSATKGTVSDFELMKAAVKANNFNIPLTQLGNLLGFAQQRAGETGESIDYMVESIVTGIARKSLPILDNLGFSAVEVREEFNKTGDMAEAVGNIISRQMVDGANATLTLSEQIAAQQATITNLKTEIGEQLAPAYKAFLDETKRGLETLSTLLSDQISGVERLAIIASYFQGSQGELMRMQINALRQGRQEGEKMRKEQESSNEQQKQTTQALADTEEQMEKTRNETIYYTEAIYALNQAHSMLGKGTQGGAVLQGIVEPTQALSIAAFDAFVAFDELGSTIGNVLTSSFDAALTSGESFFTVFAQGLKAMLAQLAATIAAALVLSVVLAAVTGGIGGLSLGSIGTAFKHFGGPAMGVPSFGINGGLGGAMQGGVEIFGKLSGADILLSSERASNNRGRQRGF